MRYLLGVIVLVLSCMLLVACGGSSSDGSDDGSGSSGVTATSAVSLDAQDYIYSYQSSANISSKSLSPKDYTASPGDAGGFSRSGCETNTLEKQIIQRSKFPDMIRCYMEVMEEYGGVTLSDDWTVVSVSMPEDSGPQEAEGGSFLMRIKKSTQGLYDMDACFGGELRTEMRTVANSDGGCSVSVVDNGEWGSGSLDIVLVGACDSDSYTSATFTESFVDDEFGFGVSSLSADNNSDVNVISGAFVGSFGGNNSTHKVYAQFDASSGSAKHDSSGTYPAMSASTMMGQYLEQGVVDCNNQAVESDDYLCCEGPEGETCPVSGGCYIVASGSSCTFDDDGVQSFTMTVDSSNFEKEFKVSSSASSYYDAVNAMDLSGDPVEPVIAFADNWNCDGSGAQSVGQEQFMAGSDPLAAMAAMEVCMAIEDEQDNFDDHSLCQNTEDTQRELWEQSME